MEVRWYQLQMWDHFVNGILPIAESIYPRLRGDGLNPRLRRWLERWLVKHHVGPEPTLPLPRLRDGQSIPDACPTHDADAGSGAGRSPIPIYAPRLRPTPSVTPPHNWRRWRRRLLFRHAWVLVSSTPVAAAAAASRLRRALREERRAVGPATAARVRTIPARARARARAGSRSIECGGGSSHDGRCCGGGVLQCLQCRRLRQRLCFSLRQRWRQQPGVQLTSTLGQRFKRRVFTRRLARFCG